MRSYHSALLRAALLFCSGCGGADDGANSDDDSEETAVTGAAENPFKGTGASDDPASNTPYGPPIETDGGTDDPNVTTRLCTELALHAEPTITRVMIVLDKSGSMRGICIGNPLDPECAGVNCNDAATRADRPDLCNEDRWSPSVAAVKSIGAAYADKVHFGLMAFPADNLCGGGTVLVSPGPGTQQSIDAALDTLSPGGGTPTGPTLEAAFTALDPNSLNPDANNIPKYVLLVTDGQPTCPTGAGFNVAPQDVSRSTQALDNLRASGVKTFVIGYDTKDDPAFASRMDEFASHGGTGKHHAVEDEATLKAELEAITRETVSCSFSINAAPNDPTHVLVKLDGQQLNLDQPDGFIIRDKTITVTGAACQKMRDGGDHVLSATVLCETVRPV